MIRTVAPRASIVVPAHNVAATLGDTLRSLLAQTYHDFEIIVVDDGSSDDTLGVACGFRDPRLRIVYQPSRGLAGARNTGIAEARGTHVGFCDAGDLWHPGKLAAHVAHLDANPRVGLSYSGARLIDQAGRPMPGVLRPRLRGVTAAHVFRRNPVGNGSAPVMRRLALDSIAFRSAQDAGRSWYFDERLRQFGEIECWLRLMLISDWQVEGIPGLLTLHRVAPGVPTAGIDAQFAQWKRMVNKLSPLNPPFFARHTPAARAGQLRDLAGRAARAGDGAAAMRLMRESLAASRQPLLHEPVRTARTLGAAALCRSVGPGAVDAIRNRLSGRRTQS